MTIWCHEKFFFFNTDGVKAYLQADGNYPVETGIDDSREKGNNYETKYMRR